IQTLLDVKKAVEKADHELKAKKLLLQKIKQNGLGNASKVSSFGGDVGGKQPDAAVSVTGDGGSVDESIVVPTKRERITLTTAPRDTKRARK
ncbi:9537_t:CDS:2, partial [Scutellospora calospora]